MNTNNFKEPWGESIVEEHKGLKEKYTKLVDYINSEEYYNLSPNAKRILSNQKVLMEAYISTLSIRLYENVDTTFIQDYSMLGILFTTFSNNFGSSFNNQSCIQPTDFSELTNKPVNENDT